MSFNMYAAQLSLCHNYNIEILGQTVDATAFGETVVSKMKINWKTGFGKI